MTTYDAICAVIGSSDGKNTTAADVSGTVTSVRIISDKVEETSENHKTLLIQEIKLINKFLIGSSNNLGGGIIEWYKQAFFDESHTDAYNEMKEQAAESKIGAKGLLFLPYLLGERAPFMDLNAKATFFGVGRDTMKSDFSRAVFESTAFVTLDLLNSIRNNYNVNCLAVSGGLARIDLVNQIKADVCNLPVYVLENFESTSLGAFILMAIATKEYIDYQEALKNIVKVRKIIQPNPKNHKYYQSSFKLYKELRDSLKPFHLVNKNLNISKSKDHNTVKVNL